MIKMRAIFLNCLLTVLLISQVNAQQVIQLYNGNIPNSKPSPNNEYSDQNGNVFKNSIPQLIAFIPPKEGANKTAVIICPGGGYSALVIGREGYGLAVELNRLGVACFILKYRLPDISTMVDPSLGPIQDAQQAIKMVREKASDWNIDTGRIGVIGFSAGGHLAATLGTHFDINYIENKKHTSLRPDFMMLIYPVISMIDSVTHPDSQHALLGSQPTDIKKYEFSNELHVTRRTPPTFLMHAADDEMAPLSNTLLFYSALLKNGVPAGMHVFAVGHHGFLAEPAKSNWFSYCVAWMRENNLLNK